MSRLNPPIQRLKEESAPARVRGSSRPALLIEMQHSRKREETEREWVKQQRLSIGSGKGYKVSIECSTRRKKGPLDSMKKPNLDDNLKRCGRNKRT